MKVLIAVPSLDYCPADFAMSLASLTHYRAKKLGQEIKIALMNQKGSIIMDARNALVEAALERECTHILFLDSDMVFPANTLERLAEVGEFIVGASYVRRVSPHTMLGKPDRAAKNLKPGLTEMETMPFGCILIKMSVFAALERPFFRYVTGATGSISEDTYFCLRAREANFRIFMHNQLTKELGHVGIKAFTV
jgi:hypothetical protein